MSIIEVMMKKKSTDYSVLMKLIMKWLLAINCVCIFWPLLNWIDSGNDWMTIDDDIIELMTDSIWTWWERREMKWNAKMMIIDDDDYSIILFMAIYSVMILTVKLMTLQCIENDLMILCNEPFLINGNDDIEVMKALLMTSIDSNWYSEEKLMNK